MFKRENKHVLKILLIVTLLLGNLTNVHAEEKDSFYHLMDEYLKEESKKAHLPGICVVIVDKEKILFTKNYGDCDSIDTPFIIGSNSKSFTAAAVMQLVEQNKIDLDKPINTYIPNIQEGDKITVRQLLNHTSGISTYDTCENYSVSESQGKWVYANTNYSILGLIIEAVSGETYTEYMKDHFFEPLNMDHTYTSLEEAKAGGLVQGYRNYYGLMVNDSVRYPDQKISGWLSIPAGYIISTASDMGKYLQFYINEGVGILEKESIKRMFDEDVKIDDDVSYGFGWCVMQNLSEPVMYHNGLVENYISYMFLLPDSEIGGVILINCNDYLVANQLTVSIFKGILSLLLGEQPEYIGTAEYEMKHFLLDLIYLTVTVVCVLPLLLIGRWKKRNRDKLCKIKDHITYRIRKYMSFVLLHLLIPTILLIFPQIVGVPLPVVKAFVPDLYIILVGNAAVAYITGVLKLVCRFAVLTF